MANIKKLVPASKGMLKKFGLVQTTNGLMFNTAKATDKKKYQSKETVPARKPKPKLAERQTKEDEAKGLY